ncbi:MAG: glycerol-3-phosphate 1-O-acyltransferase PlsY [Sphingopyxis sp.]|nr:glycerol-3-phosphate 1-O-acyltransferase PlsY [Sphingopyxis sp.]
MILVTDWQLVAIVFLCGYLLGSIPFGVILTRMFGAGDLRQIGSGNIGATNVLRTGRKGLAAATLILDGAKGAVAALMVARALPDMGDSWPMLAGAAAFIGHCYPVWLKFKGGKGVATLLGLSFAFAWPIGLAFAATWLAAVLITRISSLGGLIGSVAAPVTAFAIGEHGFVTGLTALVVLVFWRHRENLARLRAGTEPRIGGSKPK